MMKLIVKQTFTTLSSNDVEYEFEKGNEYRIYRIEQHNPNNEYDIDLDYKGKLVNFYLWEEEDYEDYFKIVVE